MSKPLPPIRAAAVNDSFAIEARAVITPVEAGEDGKPKGRPTVAINAYNGGMIRVAGYYRPLVIDLEGVTGLGKSLPLYRNHDSNRIVGHGTAQRENNSLNVAGKLSASNADTQEITDLAAEEFPWQASIGLQPMRLEQVEAGSTTTVNGQSVSGPATIVRAGKLYEVSIVSNGADDTTSTKVAAKLFDGDLPMGFEAWLTAKGFVKAELSDSQLTSLKAMFEAETKPPADKDKTPTVDAVLQAARDKEKRQAAFGRIIESAIDRGMDTETAEKLVVAATNDNLSETAFELQVLRATRHEGSSRASSSHGNVSTDIIEAALARQTGQDVEEMFKPEVLEASEKQFKHGLSLVELMQHSARRNGFRDISHRDTKALLRAAFAPVQAAGASTYDLGGVLSNVANKMIVAGFDSVESEWRKVAAIKPVNDLKEHKSYALTGDFEYKEVGKGGEITHATMSEEEYSNRAKTHARMFAVTEDDIINDDLGAFVRVRNLIGRGGALAFNKIFWTEFLADVTSFYTSGRGNYFEGAATYLDVDSLSTGFTTFESLTDPNGNPLGLTPGVLVVPTALKITGNRLVNDPEIRVNGASSKTTYTTANPHAGKVELAASTYLNNANIPNGSATHWFLIADPMDMALIEAAFLYGQQTPRVEAAEADFNQLGIQMRGVFRFGVAKQEYRAGVRSKGAA